ncbi:pirin family protein [Kangiella sp. TOML190]|uniref:pirin family protein n=1 Tax=Kangiella sp. TOML190 TaxID=2931351 RepID=UPI00204177BA|nr:pirin family protein [Kangiella sp. TOML190]
MKNVIAINSAPAKHWVGNAFHVSSMFSYQSHGETLSPFLLLDHAAPKVFEPSANKRGVGEHPHRGFETVTIVYQGEVEHRDSTGAGGVIGTGDVQWMTAGSGIMHEEFLSTDFTQTGGEMEMAQLWVNLPAKHKMTTPKYQDIQASQIPTLQLGDNAGQLRLIAGDYQDSHGPASTFSPLQVMDTRINAGKKIELELNQGWTGAVVVLSGTVEINSERLVRERQMAVLSTEGTGVSIEANNDAKLLILSGEPLNEPIVGYGPFVMNSREEIEATLRDFKNGDFGSIS